MLLSLIGVMLFWLVLLRSQRAAAWWVLSVVLCAVFTGILKLLFYGCPHALYLNNPSGHASLITLMYGAISLVTATESKDFFPHARNGKAAYERSSYGMLSHRLRATKETGYCKGIQYQHGFDLAAKLRILAWRWATTG